MEGYNSGPRPLPWSLQNPLVESVVVEDDGDFAPSSFVWPTDPNERTVIGFWLSLNEYNILGSAIDVGSDIAFAEDALRVMWLWMRNFRIHVPVGGEIVSCCGPSVSERTFINTQINETNVIYQTNYSDSNDGTDISTIAPNMVYGGSWDAFIDKLMCLGIEMVVQSVINQAKAVQSATDEQRRDVVQQVGLALASLAAAGGAAIAIGGGAAAIVSIIGGPWALLGLALAGIGTGVASLFVSVGNEALNDVAAYNAVLCTMRENMMGNAPSFENFRNILTPNDFAVGSNEEKIASIVFPFINDVNFYLQFIVSMNGLYDTNIWQTLPECETCNDADIQLVSAAGWPAYATVYDGQDGLDEVYMITMQVTAHYAKMGVVERELDLFTVMDVQVSEPSPDGYIGVGNGNFPWDSVPNNLGVAGLGFYRFPHGCVVTIKVRAYTP